MSRPPGKFPLDTPSGSNVEKLRQISARKFSRLVVVSGIEDRLDLLENEELARNLLHRARVLLVGVAAPDLAAIRQGLSFLEVGATAAASRVDHLADVVRMHAGFTHVLVNLDAFEDIDLAVEVLGRFRVEAPDIIVVLLSAQVRADAPGSERRQICDATLRLPLSTQRLRDGLLAATLNHSRYRAMSRDADRG